VEAAFAYYAQRVGRLGVCGVISPYTLGRNPLPHSFMFINGVFVPDCEPPQLCSDSAATNVSALKSAPQHIVKSSVDPSGSVKKVKKFEVSHKGANAAAKWESKRGGRSRPRRWLPRR